MFDFKKIVEGLSKKFSFSDINQSASKSEFKDLFDRAPFSKFLPWIAYDEEKKLYYNSDSSIGFMWECTPLCFAGEKTASTAEGLFRLPLPDYSVMQFILIADDYIDHYINAYLSSKTRQDEIVQESARESAKHLLEGTKGLSNNSGIPVRNFRLFITLKIPVKSFDDFGVNIDEIYLSTMDMLTGMQVFPRDFTPPALLAWTRRFFNDDPGPNIDTYYDYKAIRDQIINSETDLVDTGTTIKCGKKIFRCITPKAMPQDVDFIQTNELTGGIWGMTCDMDQIKTPFMYCNNVIWQDLRAPLHLKCNLVLSQQSIGSFARSLARKQDEYSWATDELERGARFFRTMPTCWVWSDEESKVNESISRVKRIWQTSGYVMQEDRGITKPLFISSLPFGLYANKESIDLLERDFIAPASSIIQTLPLQADFAGSGRPVLAYVGRKGQLCGLDLFDKRATNHNLAVFASSGSGKSFNVGQMAYQYYSTGALIRMIDIGGSYEKLVNMVGGKLLSFDEYSKVVMNPFTTIMNPDHDLPIVAAIVLQMCYCSFTDAKPSQTEMTLAKEAVNWAYAQEGTAANIDDAWEYLRKYPLYKKDDGSPVVRDIVRAAHTLAFNLADFTKEGTYGSYFYGPSTFNIKDDPFVVLELEHIKARKELFNVITLIVIDATTRDLYLSDRETPRMIIFDEAHQFLTDGEIIKPVIAEGYRRARKYLGSFSIISQSLLDRQLFGSVGDVIWNNSAFRFLLQSSDYEKAAAEKLITYDPFVMEILKGVATNKPQYSEIFVDTMDIGSGVVRLVSDPFSYYIYTSDPKDNAKINDRMNHGMSRVEAIRSLMAERK